MDSVKRFLPIVMFSFSFFTAFILLGVLVNNSLTDEVQLFEGIIISVISSLLFVTGKWFVSKIEAGDSLSEKMDDNLAQSVLNIWMIIGAAALYISFNAHRNLEDFVLLEVIVFSLIIWKTSTKQLKLTDNDLKKIKSELEVTESKLKANEDELEATKSKLKAAEAELKTTKIELKTIESNLKATEAELNAAKEQLKEASFDKEYSL
ncbi:coiled-coil domain-containing protein [Nostoc sp.]|uniref:coiled-coil domain-containing protein n=1 Tax=Nostoc sp. TaxID=1180 RepID=UPI002FF6C3E5